MGQYNNYVCEVCGYEVDCNPTGKDLVMAGPVTTYVCEDCQEVMNILDKDEKVCEICGSTNLQPWNPTTGLCPKCGAPMKETGLKMMVD